MTDERSIVIGCDSTVDLSVILNSMKGKGSISFSPNVISATRTSDLISIVKSLDPDLVILCFRNNQHVLNDFNSFVKKPGIPVLCLTRAHENEPLYWHPGSIVFTYPMQHITNTEYLVSRINSIFLLKNEPVKKTDIQPFPERPALQQHRDNTSDMSRYVMELDQKTGILSKVKERIADLYPKVDDSTRTALTSIVNSIKMSANDQKLWNDFKLNFEMTDPGFLLQLAQKHPELTTMDLKYCCYLKMNMTNDDIRNVFGINQESVRTHKYRLKKKMALAKEEDLCAYLRSVGE